MKGKMHISTIVTALALALVAWTLPAFAATNSADNVAGGSHTLTNSGNVTVTSTAMQLYKAVFVNDGGSWTCKASIPADATCNASATSVNVPTGTTVKFLIYVKNATDITLADIRFTDQLDDSGFTYSAGTMKRTQTGASEPLSTDTVATIFTNADTGTALTDAKSNADVGAMDTSVSPDDLDVGGSGGVGDNATLALSNGKAFGVLFQAIVN